MLKKKYYLIVSGAFDRDPVIFKEYPSDEDIIKAIREKGGKTARVEKRYVLKEL